MILIKTSAETIGTVIREAKHAVNHYPKYSSKDELILIAQTKGSLLPGQKPIRWVMDLEKAYMDLANESDKLWGRHWNFLIKGRNVRVVDQFDIEEVKVSAKDYNAAVSFCYVDPADERIILENIMPDLSGEDKIEEILEEFEPDRVLNYDEIIEKMDKKFSGVPKYENRIVRLIQRPTSLKNALIARDGTKCKICKADGFQKKNGGKYAEVHHMIELNRLAPKTLQSWNILIVCPNCHKMLHYANVKTTFLNPGWEITINGEMHRLI